MYVNTMVAAAEEDKKSSDQQCPKMCVSVIVFG